MPVKAASAAIGCPATMASMAARLASSPANDRWLCQPNAMTVRLTRPISASGRKRTARRPGVGAGVAAAGRSAGTDMDPVYPSRQRGGPPCHSHVSGREGEARRPEKGRVPAALTGPGGLPYKPPTFKTRRPRKLGILLVSRGRGALAAGSTGAPPGTSGEQTREADLPTEQIGA